jgi:hypothetical protein
MQPDRRALDASRDFLRVAAAAKGKRGGSLRWPSRLLTNGIAFLSGAGHRGRHPQAMSLVVASPRPNYGLVFDAAPSRSLRTWRFPT